MNWRIYLPSLLLVSMALLINAMAFIAPNVAPTAATGKLVEEMTVADRIREAETFVTLGDAAYGDGSGMFFNDDDALHSAQINYRQAWRLITDQEFPAGQQRSDLLVDSAALNAIQEHLKVRLKIIADKLGAEE